MKLLALIRAPFAWKVVRQHDGYTYLENTVTGRCDRHHGHSQVRCYFVARLGGLDAQTVGVPLQQHQGQVGDAR